MKIKNIFYTFFLLCILIINTTSNASNSNYLPPDPIITRKSYCKHYLLYYGISINIRSQTGWQRVIKNNNLQIYTNENFLTINYKNKCILEQCIIDPEFNSRQIFDRGDQQ